MLNALKALGNINDEIPLISPSIIEPIQKLKVNSLGNHNPRLHTDEILIALSISATMNPISHLALQQLDKLKDCEAHSTVILSQVDANTFRKLKINLTCEDRYQTKNYIINKSYLPFRVKGSFFIGIKKQSRIIFYFVLLQYEDNLDYVFSSRNKSCRKMVFSSAFYIKISKDRKNKCTNKVYQQVFHCI